MTYTFKNPQIVSELFDVDQIRYLTWTYNERHDFYYDIILTDKELAIVGKDIVSEHFLSKISSCVAYFGSLDDEYDENYDDFSSRWGYGDGEIMIYFSDCSGKEWEIIFKQARFEEARQFFIELRNKTRYI